MLDQVQLDLPPHNGSKVLLQVTIHMGGQVRSCYLVGIVPESCLFVVEGLERLVLALPTLPVVAAGHVALLGRHKYLAQLSQIVGVGFCRRPHIGGEVVSFYTTSIAQGVEEECPLQGVVCRILIHTFQHEEKVNSLQVTSPSF